MTVHMKTVKPLVYAGRRLAVGAEFDARGKQDARLLAAIGKAVEFTPEAKLPTPTQLAPTALKPRSQQAQPASDFAPVVAHAESAPQAVEIIDPVAAIANPAPMVQASDRERTKRQYRRRDMTATDSE